MKNRQILNLAVPSIISNITIPLLGFVDVAITGHMGNAGYMAAIAVGSMIFNIMYWLFSFLRFGTGGMTAQACGESDALGNDFDSCCVILVRSLIVSVLAALLLLLFQVPIFKLSMFIIEPVDNLVGIIESYYSICIWGTLPSLAFYALNGWLVGMQNTKLPMIVSVLQNVINICLSCFFVYYLGMKIEGVALGTLFAQWSGFAVSLTLIGVKYRTIWNRFSIRSRIKPIVRSVFARQTNGLSVNQTLFLRTLFLIAVNLYFIVAGAKCGEVILAVNSVLMQLFVLYSYVMDGFAFAAEALCGKYYGAKDKYNFSLALNGVWRWSVALTVIYTLAYWLGGNLLVQLLTDESSVIASANEFLPWAIAIPFCGVAAFVLDGVFVGITNTSGMLMGTLCGAMSFFLIYFATNQYLGNHSLWLAFNIYLLVRGLVQYMVFKKKRPLAA